MCRTSTVRESVRGEGERESQGERGERASETRESETGREGEGGKKRARDARTLPKNRGTRPPAVRQNSRKTHFTNVQPPVFVRVVSDRYLVGTENLESAALVEEGEDILEVPEAPARYASETTLTTNRFSFKCVKCSFFPYILRNCRQGWWRDPVCRAQISRFTIEGLGCRVWSRVEGLVLREAPAARGGAETRFSGCRFQDSGFRIDDSGLGCRFKI